MIEFGLIPVCTGDVAFLMPAPVLELQKTWDVSFVGPTAAVLLTCLTFILVFD